MKRERIAKLMAARGMCSRRQAEQLIEARQVLVNGVLVSGQGQKALPCDEITIAPGGAEALANQVTVLLHKPAGVVSTQPQEGQIPAWKLLRVDTHHGQADSELLQRVVAEPWTLSVAGRLDRASRGLLVLTQDGSIARRIVGGEGVEKSYCVRTIETATERQVRRLRGDLDLDGRRLLPMDVRKLSAHELRFVLVEGRKHQIRRVCRKVGLTVVDIFRAAIGPLAIADLPEGQWRLASAGELARLRAEGRVKKRKSGRRNRAPRRG